METRPSGGRGLRSHEAKSCEPTGRRNMAGRLADHRLCETAEGAGNERWTAHENANNLSAMTAMARHFGAPCEGRTRYQNLSTGNFFLPDQGSDGPATPCIIAA